MRGAVCAHTCALMIMEVNKRHEKQSCPLDIKNQWVKDWNTCDIDAGILQYFYFTQIDQNKYKRKASKENIHKFPLPFTHLKLIYDLQHLDENSDGQNKIAGDKV